MKKILFISLIFLLSGCAAKPLAGSRALFSPSLQNEFVVNKTTRTDVALKLGEPTFYVNQNYWVYRAEESRELAINPKQTLQFYFDNNGLLIRKEKSDNYVEARVESKQYVFNKNDLHENESTQTEIFQKLGRYYRPLLGGKVWTYRIKETGTAQQFEVTPNHYTWEDIAYSLVLTFDDRKILRKISLIDIKKNTNN